MADKYSNQNDDRTLNLEGLSKRYWRVSQYIKKWDHTSVEERLMITEILRKIFELTENSNLKNMISKRARKLSVAYGGYKKGRLE